MARLDDLINHLESLLHTLKRHRRAVRPEVGRFFTTLNDSIVFVYSMDPDGEAQAVVLKGGHGLGSCMGEMPGESYVLDCDGYYKSEHMDLRMVMSLAKKLNTKLPTHPRNSSDKSEETPSEKPDNPTIIDIDDYKNRR